MWSRFHYAWLVNSQNICSNLQGVSKKIFQPVSIVFTLSSYEYSPRKWKWSVTVFGNDVIVSLPQWQRTLDEDCRQAEEPKQLADEASRFHLGRQRQHSAVICSGALLSSSRVLHPSLVTLCSHKSGRCAVEVYHAPHLWYPPSYTSPMAHGFQCSPTLNR